MYDRPNFTGFDELFQTFRLALQTFWAMLGSFMRFTFNIFKYSLRSLLHRCLYIVGVLFLRIGDLLGGFQAKVQSKRIGSLRLCAPESAVTAILVAIDRLKEKDITLYECLVAGRGFRILGGSDTNYLSFEHGLFILSIRTMRSQEALVSLFVLWRFLQENTPFRERVNKQILRERVKQSSLQTAVWLEAKEYPVNIVEWMKIDGLEKDTVPHRIARKAKSEN